MATLRDLQAALQRKSGFEFIRHAESPDGSQLRISGRQPKDRMGMNIKNWLFVVDNLITASEVQGSPWSVDISKHHVHRSATSRQVVYYWRVIFQSGSTKISDHYDAIMKAIMSAEFASRGEVTEFPLPGAGRDRNASGGVGKGRGVSNTR